MNIEFLKRLFTACSEKSGISFADGLNLSELYQRLDEVAVAESKIGDVCDKVGLDGENLDSVLSMTYDFAQACELQGFANGFRLCAQLSEELSEKAVLS